MSTSVLVPSDGDGLRRSLAAVHRRYAGHVHGRLKRTGHFWQGRFGCVALDEDHATAALRYVAMNPVRAGLSERAADWRWSSVHAWLDPDHGDGLTDTAPVVARHPDIAAMLAAGEEHTAFDRLRRAETIGRPVGDAAFVARLEQRAGRQLAPARRGRKPKAAEEISALSP
ncbi:hypothetical protein [Sphingomonas sp.]|jgi:putative transposase|uniref:hypothetical protein n=1 Tax=Sphingomonas sp. TaxID=28214 RepID=UPI002E3816F3|nr:hypothetical protein [Sphingomonas sp.]HEX4693134.1 hypothetical protein [Sphingomonas sp.]